MFLMQYLLRLIIYFSLSLSVIYGLLIVSIAYADSSGPYSYSVRSRISEQTVLGKDAPESFESYDLSANFKLPRHGELSSNWWWYTRLMASVGLLKGAGDNALVVSAIPGLMIVNDKAGFTMDVGAGGALFSQYRFGTQDFGGPFQFALTVGASVPIYERIGVGYRFMHYSDAGLNGNDTIGADFHMIELQYGLP